MGYVGRKWRKRGRGNMRKRKGMDVSSHFECR